jgi:nitrite reductase/ring-hydroxylating ferredoxin subunit
VRLHPGIRKAAFKHCRSVLGDRVANCRSSPIISPRRERYFGNADRRELARGGQMVWTRAAAVAEVKERGVVDADVGGEEIALYWVDDEVYATHNVCTHAFARLSEGFLEGDCIECPIHQAVFNVKTGEVVAPPAYTAVKTYPCRIEGDDVLVDI